MVLRQTPLIKKPQDSLKNCVLGSIILVPAFFFMLVIVHPLGSQFSAYASFFRWIILVEVVLCCALILLSRAYQEAPFTGDVPSLRTCCYHCDRFYVPVHADIYLWCNGQIQWLPVLDPLNSGRIRSFHKSHVSPAGVKSDQDRFPQRI